MERVVVSRGGEQFIVILHLIGVRASLAPSNIAAFFPSPITLIYRWGGPLSLNVRPPLPQLGEAG